MSQRSWFDKLTTNGERGECGVDARNCARACRGVTKNGGLV